MDRHAVALVLQEIAALLQSDGENRFRARAFRAAARAVELLDTELAGLVAAGTLTDVPGIGPATARVIEELVVTGESSYHASLLEQGPATLQHLLRVPGLGAGRIHQLHEALGITDLDSLEAAARSGAIAKVRGFGERTQQSILEGIPFARSVAGRRTLHHAAEAAHRLAAFIQGLPGVIDAVVAGTLRRRLEIADRIVLVAAVEGHDVDLASALRRTGALQWDAGDDGVLRARLADGVPVEVRVAREQAFGAVLCLATGSEAHLAALAHAAAAAGVRLEQRGLVRDGVVLATPDERDVYRMAGLQFVPPELREGGEEVELAARKALPQLVELADLRGCFHCHTTYSDGAATLEEMAEGALALGWRYLGLADHSRSAGYAGGLTADRVREQHREIDAWNRKRGGELHIFRGIEADILQDGALDFDAQGEGDVLASMDYVVGSVHSRFRQDRASMTARMLAAAAHPRLTFLGHATGRLLLMRDGYDVDLDAVIRQAADSGAAIEINADPRRMELAWDRWALPRQLGVKTAINPDAHSVDGLRNVLYGVYVARKAWLTPADIINCWELQDVQAWLEERKQRGSAG
jgi:DNA polymerase (family X)